VKFYDNLSEWWHLASETIHQYNNNDENDLLTSTTEFFYENPVHLQLTKTVSTVNNSKITTAFKYPLDYSNVTASDEISVGVLNLQQNHILNPVIEKTVFRSDISGTNSRLLNAVFTQYDGKNPTKVHAMEESAPVTNFVASGMQSGAVVKDNRYVPQIIYDKYGDQGNLMQFHKSSDANQSFLWDVTNIYPIAEAKNTAVEDISYTSFEQNESTSWHYLGAINGSSAITGKRSYSLAEGAIAKSGLSVSKKYIVSYWTTSGSNYLIAGTQGDVIRGVSINGWTYFKHVVVGQSEISIAGTGFIDELRLYPEGAQMATYTYEPLIGITSKCDVNDFISYYEYDEFSRLKIVRDQNGNIVKRICYNYSGQSTPCAN
jgi:hypothetical protein